MVIFHSYVSLPEYYIELLSQTTKMSPPKGGSLQDVFPEGIVHTTNASSAPLMAVSGPTAHVHHLGEILGFSCLGLTPYVRYLAIPLTYSAVVKPFVWI